MQPLVHTCGVTLAGGRSARFGSPKCLARLGESSLAERVLAAHLAVFPRVLLVANEPGIFGDLGVEVIRDRTPGLGPLGGLLTALDHAAPLAVCITPCDAPFVTPELLKELATFSPLSAVVLPRSEGRLGFEPLFGWYSPSVAERLRAFLNEGGRAAHEFIATLTNVAYHPMEASGGKRFPDHVFMNINTPADLQAAEQILEALDERNEA